MASASSYTVSIIIGTDGSFFRSAAVQAIPLIRGNWMSISTTSGADSGISRSASSPEAQTQAQRKPTAPAMYCDTRCRNSALSSTIATEIGRSLWLFRIHAVTPPEGLLDHRDWKNIGARAPPISTTRLGPSSVWRVLLAPRFVATAAGDKWQSLSPERCAPRTAPPISAIRAAMFRKPFPLLIQ